ncbi:exopolysaccharide production protein ExoZ [Pseudorhizobium tarimense]|uniref:Exopolysaccharide production protein ExoZ n=1 Tax=Pseudorhizobium tarimense TaxID=1079109 RepID=A0ABV2H0U3_9HYPH|nr:acyltransferase [Pseudorhizobium tarimense]MCJ8517480.1 acyltransferase [Pseudorhizobium tarimense]
MHLTHPRDISQTRGTLYGIQYLRAFAAAAVVVFHAAERNGLHFNIGAAGVDVFFVVSGFIMMVINARRPAAPMQFLRDRLLRIAPSYWIVTTIMLAGAAAGLFPNLLIEPLHVLGSYLFLPVPSPNGGHLWPVLVQGWTLNYEMFFYLVFAAALLAPSGKQLPLMAGVLLLLVLAGSLTGRDGPLLSFYTQPLILEFAGGAWLGTLWLRGKTFGPLLGTLMIVTALAGFSTIELGGFEFDAWTCGPLAMALVAGVLALEAAKRLPNLPMMAYVGDASYSTYLWHTLALAVVTKAGTHLGLSPLTVAAAGVVAGVLIGVVAYEVVEKPIQSLVKRRRLAPGQALTRPPGH